MYILYTYKQTDSCETHHRLHTLLQETIMTRPVPPVYITAVVTFSMYFNTGINKIYQDWKPSSMFNDVLNIVLKFENNLNMRYRETDRARYIATGLPFVNHEMSKDINWKHIPHWRYIRLRWTVKGVHVASSNQIFSIISYWSDTIF